jgi:Glutathione S-transferase, N-terminal domain
VQHSKIGAAMADKGQERRAVRNISALLPRADVGADIVEPPLSAVANLELDCAFGRLFRPALDGGSMIKVYSFFNSICTQKVFITLAEKGIPYDTHNIDLFKNEQFKPEYLKINPKRVVPALDHDGRIVIESTLIC